MRVVGRSEVGCHSGCSGGGDGEGGGSGIERGG